LKVRWPVATSPELATQHKPVLWCSLSTLRLDLEEKIEKGKGEGDIVQVQQANNCCGFQPCVPNFHAHAHWPLRPLRAVGLVGDGQRCWFCFFAGSRRASVFLFLQRFSLGFYFFASVHMRFLLISIRLL
jgi:hypothetical protein